MQPDPARIKNSSLSKKTFVRGSAAGPVWGSVWGSVGGSVGKSVLYKFAVPAADPRTHVSLEKDAFLIRFDPFWIRLGIRLQIRCCVPGWGQDRSPSGSKTDQKRIPLEGNVRPGTPKCTSNAVSTHPKRTRKRIQNKSKTDLQTHMHSPMHVKRIVRLLHNNRVLAEPDFHNPIGRPWKVLWSSTALPSPLLCCTKQTINECVLSMKMQ